ncbi:hypothetical protein J6524_06480 [Bradyrhizobium sp. WSM 1738]|uniref:hypothetical protein n=1 Tax=Bradyrhizobium hereditatis TaxID=2821405 RepID=UPI001CE250D2|nr:hypothetical protein [Bradyrhizobium hereditatis]MCA6114567.1 hypothetical protein [Bradyrhizobium hereditatis]
MDKRSSGNRDFWIKLLFWIAPLLAYHRILPICSPAVDPAWQLKVNPDGVRLRAAFQFSPRLKLAVENGIASSNA